MGSHGALTAMACYGKCHDIVMNMFHGGAVGGLPWDCDCRIMVHPWVGSEMVVQAIAMRGSS